MEMDKTFLTINIGSSSKRYCIFEGKNKIFSAHFEHGAGKPTVSYLEQGESAERQKEIPLKDFENALEVFSNTFNEKFNGKYDISEIGIRIVAPGEYFSKHRIINEEFINKFRDIKEKDPAHIELMLSEIAMAEKIFRDKKLVAVSDSAFHASMPNLAKEYAIPHELSKELGLSRFGYHGLSVSAAADFIKKRASIHGHNHEERVVVCHLGNGASVTALLHGRSVETSMGFSPVEGLVMSSRSGDIDAGALLEIVRARGVEETQKLLYARSGLLALSGFSDDMRVLVEAEEHGHHGSHRAIEAFIYRIKKYIGSYSAVLGGIDALVFSGAIGERSPDIRKRIVDGLEYLGLVLDGMENRRAVPDAVISKKGGPRIYVVRSDEAFEIAKVLHSNSFL